MTLNEKLEYAYRWTQNIMLWVLGVSRGNDDVTVMGEQSKSMRMDRSGVFVLLQWVIPNFGWKH